MLKQNMPAILLQYKIPMHDTGSKLPTEHDTIYKAKEICNQQLKKALEERFFKWEPFSVADPGCLS